MSRISRALGLSVVAATLVAGAAAVAWAQPSGSGQDPVAGARVFDAKGCVKCHALEGRGGKIGPDLARVSRPHSFYDLAAAMWNHLPRMTERMKQLGIPRPKLDADEAKNLVAFLYTLGYFDRPGNADNGKRLFVSKHCVECHGGSGPGPSLAGLKTVGSALYAAAAMWNHGPQMADAMKAKGIERPAFTAAELRDVIAYLSPGTAAAAGVFALPGDAERGRLLFAEKQCVQCHAAGGTGGAVGPPLTDKRVRRSPIEFAAAIWNKAPAMATAMAARGITVPPLKPEEMADLVAYLYTSGYFAGGGSPNRGWTTLAAKGCLVCHGVFGERGKTASDLAAAPGPTSSARVLAELWNHTTVTAPTAAPWPTFQAQEMADLIALLQGIRRPQ